MKKILCVVLVLVMLVGMTVSCFADHDNAYWALQKEFNKAVESGNNQSIISSANKIVNLYYGRPSADRYFALVSPLKYLAKAYEELGQYDKLVNVYKMQNVVYQWLQDSGNFDSALSIRANNTILNHFTDPELYIATTNEDTIPYYGAKNEPRIGTFSGMCDYHSDGKTSAYALYVAFGTEQFNSYLWKIPSTNYTYYMELAWNCTKYNIQELNQISNGDFDIYAISNLQAMQNFLNSNSNCKMLIRLFAEVDAWGESVTNPTGLQDAYIKAFRRIANLVRIYCPDAAIVYSPMDKGAVTCDQAMFYPGDEYVDWIGASCYGNVVDRSNPDYWCIGKYQNLVVRMKEVIDLAKKHSKPVMISECGFAYQGTDGLQTEKHSIEELTEFYTYINMVYPQIKLIIYFNTNVGGEYYALTSFGKVTGNANVQKTYFDVINKNESIYSTIHNLDELVSYTKLSNFVDKTDVMKIYTYIPYPSTSEKTVKYYLGSDKIFTSTSYPYTLELDTSKLKVGVNKLSAKIQCDNTTITKAYIIYKHENGVIDTRVSSFKDLLPDEYYVEPIAWAIENEITNGTSDHTFEPDAYCTRGQIVTFLWRALGCPEPQSQYNPFKDNISGEYYYKAVLWAYQNNITLGTTGVTFSPEETCTRAQAVTFLFRACAGNQVIGNNPFTDIKESEYYYDSVLWAVANGITNGTTKTTFSPDDNCTRGQIVTFIFRSRKLFSHN